MKANFQIYRFINSNEYHSKIDWEMISLFCTQSRKIKIDLSPKISESGITSSMFTKWVDEGFGAGDIVKYNNDYCILGDTSIGSATIIGTIVNDEKIDLAKNSVNTRDLSHVSEEIRVNAIRILSKNNLQYCEKYNCLIEKYIPHVNERILFQNEHIKGLGVVRSIDVANNFIELYCFYIYTTGEVRYSMHESNVCTVHDYWFEPMSISAQRRLNRELGKEGKVWNDKMHRIENVNYELPKGEKYWYITDKMKMATDTEKGGIKTASHSRYLAGNYFHSPEACIDYLGKVNEIFKDRLAKPNTPKKPVNSSENKSSTGK